MPVSAERLIRYDRLQPPPGNLDVLVEPAAERVHALVRDGLDDATRRCAVLNTTVGALRDDLRRQLEVRGPLILTGHQPDFFHAGVFAKIIAAHELAAPAGGTAALLTVDSDQPKSTSLLVPQTTGHGLRRVAVQIPGLDPQRPYELQPRVARTSWLQLFASLAALHEFRDRSLVDAFARGWLTTTEPEPAYCDAFDRGRAAVERELGINGVRELRMSGLAQTPAFRSFVAHLLLHARSLAENYNAAQADFRIRHRVRAPGRPVPPLVIDEDTIEMPLWVQGVDEPRRRLFVTTRGATLELHTDNRVLTTIDADRLADAETHGRPWSLEEDGWQLRPRALLLSAFARLFVADLFIHGIGGAKYDEVTEDFVTALLGAPPGPMCCISATVRLPLALNGVTRVDVDAARQAARDVRCNPQRRLPAVPDSLERRRRELVRESDELRRKAPRDHARRRTVFRELRRVKEQMLAQDPWRSAELDQRVQTLEQRWQVDQIALDREYFFALHLRQTLADSRDRIRTAFRPAGA
jgi:hypothetical protein